MPERQQPPAEAFATRCRAMGHSITQCTERVKTSSRQLLLHCNLLLDCQGAVHTAEVASVQLAGRFAWESCWMALLLSAML